MTDSSGASGFDPAHDIAQSAIARCFTAMPERMAKALVKCGESTVGELWSLSGEMARAVLLALAEADRLPARSLLYNPEPLDEDGWTDWIKPLPGYILQCCDCGSLHEMQFRVEDGDVAYRAKPIDCRTASPKTCPETPSQIHTPGAR